MDKKLKYALIGVLAVIIIAANAVFTGVSNQYFSKTVNTFGGFTQGFSPNSTSSTSPIHSTLDTALSFLINSITAYPAGHSFYSSSTPTRGAIAIVPGVLHCIVPGVTTTGITDFYNASTNSGTKIYSMGAGAKGSFCLDASFSTGVFASSTVTTDTYTVTYHN